ncbi:hypothetical protein CEXT_283911 [Caerostris extrusa]|uniref:Uncharacterized protein n=1 Tax=Caerostris extrusa TaxID=172846 RepID=A0AAV4XH31_CAEEX|nr:hypothetical protein CEXT_283911 [Caerostris extrusa]
MFGDWQLYLERKAFLKSVYYRGLLRGFEERLVKRGDTLTDILAEGYLLTPQKNLPAAPTSHDAGKFPESVALFQESQVIAREGCFMPQKKNGLLSCFLLPPPSFFCRCPSPGTFGSFREGRVASEEVTDHLPSRSDLLHKKALWGMFGDRQLYLERKAFLLTFLLKSVSVYRGLLCGF